MIKNGKVEEALVSRNSGSEEAYFRELSEHYLAPGGRYYYGSHRGDLGIREFWRSLQRHRLLVMTIVVTITALATIIMLRAKSTYLASTVLEIGKDNSTLIKSGDLLLQNEESDAATTVAIKTKMVMMKSHELLEDVVVNLQLDQNPKFLDGQSQWSLKRLINLGGNQKQPKDAQAEGMIKSAEDGVRPAAERSRLDPYVRQMEENLNVEQIKETRALKVSFLHTDPAIAAAVADGVAQRFIQRNFQGKTENFSNAAAWLSQSTQELKGRVERAEQAMVNYTRANNIFTIEGTSTLTTDKLSKLHDQATRAEADRILKETLYEEVKQGRVSEVPEVFAEMTSKSTPRIIELQKQLDEMTKQEAQLSVYYGPSNPQLQEVRQQIVAVKEQLDGGRKALNEKLRTEYEHAVRDEQSLKEALVKAKAEAVDENQAAIQYNIMKQEVETAKALYTEFLQKSNQSKIQVAEQYSNIHIIDHAKVPVTSAGPRRALNILLWFTISLVIGVGGALLLEFLDNTIKDSNDVGQHLQLSTLATVPAFKTEADQYPLGGRDRQLLAEEPDPAHEDDELMAGSLPIDQAPYYGRGDMMIQETYHALRTSVLLSSVDGPPKTILVTSTEPGEGKTTTTVNLAFSLCELDSRVLVIDADMRRPTTHKLFGVDQYLGLSTCLLRDVNVNKLIHRLNKPNLSLLPGGPIPPNPASLISSAKMKMLLDDLSKDYDFILIDSPPVGSVTDSAILSTMVDGVLLVVQAGKSGRDTVRRVKYDLLSVGARILGVVLNKAGSKNDPYGY
ncbi:MAG TPA: polysaccharide biosynthesis tyrosine autokinase [Blastocatellia bacterium]|nr:polysaccharide biosynthesis tyrosine autokinase [Blastocatellia bacterium]